MSKLRRIPTSMTSGHHLVLALQAAGFKEVERTGAPLELISWRGKPIEASAEIVVRRRYIGATADDLGFSRGADGRYEAIVSEILLGRFDRRWFAELEKRYAELAGVAPSAEVAPAPSKPSAPPSERVEYAVPAPTPPAAKPAPGERRPEPPRPSSPSVRVEPPVARTAPLPTPPPTVGESDATVATTDASGASIEQDVVAVLSAAKRAGQGGGCLPILAIWAFFSFAALVTRAPLLLFLVTVVAAWAALRSLKLRKERAFAAAAAEFRARFGSRAEARERALAKLRSEIGRLPSEQRSIVEHLLRRTSW